MFVQMDELPSMYSRPLLSRSNAPRPSTKTSGSCSGERHSLMLVNGCQTNRLSQAINCSVFHSLMTVELSDIRFGLRIIVVVSDELIKRLEIFGRSTPSLIFSHENFF